MYAVLPHGVPGVGAFDAFGAQAVGGPALVIEQMRRLHRGDDAERGEALDIRQSDNLGVLHTVAPVARTVPSADGGEYIECDAIGAVADGMKRELKSGTVAFERHLLQLLRVYAQNSGRLGSVGVRREHCSRARAERTIEKRLHRAGLRPRIPG